MTIPTVRLADARDIEDWLALAREVEHLFGPMAEAPAFREALMTAIEDRQAFTALLPANGVGGSVAGGVVVSREMNSVEWFVVSASARGLGIGRQLLIVALSRLDCLKPVSVQTFAPSIAEGLAARRLYRKFGFEDCEPMGPNPAGIDTVLMVKRPCAQVD